MSISIRYINPRYYPSLVIMMDKVAQEKKYLTRTKGPTLDKMKLFGDESIEKKLPYYVALDNGQVIGNVSIEVVAYQIIIDFFLKL